MEDGGGCYQSVEDGVVAMALSVEEQGGRFRVWAVCSNSCSSGGNSPRTLLVRVDDYAPSVWLPCPVVQPPDAAAPHDPSPDDLERLKKLLNIRLPADCHVTDIVAATVRPIMYYRPATPEGDAHLRLTLTPGCNCKKAAERLEKAAADGHLRQHGFIFCRGTAALESDAKLLHRFLTNTGLSGGAWFHIPSATAASAAAARAGAVVPGASGSSEPGLDAEIVAAAEAAAVIGGRGGGNRSSGGYTVVPPGPDRVSSCDLEIRAPWRAVDCLTPDATELADAAWQPEVMRRLGALAPANLVAGARAAAAGAIPALRVMSLDVLLATADGSMRSVNAAKDPVIAISCQTREIRLGRHGGVGLEGGDAAESRGQQQQQQQQHDQTVVFLLAEPPDGGARVPLAGFETEGARLRFFATESALLEAWRDHVVACDPDAFVLFEVRDSLGALVTRFQQLQVDGGGLHLSRLTRPNSKPLGIKSVVQYSPAWVKSQSRMAATSNQETFKAEIQGRLVFDVLRQVLTAQLLATFTLTDCVQSLLRETIELLAPHHLAALQRQVALGDGATLSSGEGGSAAATVAAQQAAAVRLARYTQRRAGAVWQLTERLATLPECFEMARATGLTVQQVLYNAQMIRTWSLLHRAAHRKGYIIGGKPMAQTLSESPHLMHPIECNTAGMYKEPVAVLDFASLYPSLYRAYNLCYSTLVHKDDVPTVGRDRCTITPTGAAFVKPALRRGILPDILAALMTARASTRAALKGEADPSQRAVLEGRQKALKLTANALYGFTGAPASPLQCVPLADSCLALGAATCRGAVSTIEELVAAGELGPHATGGRVVYAQTDSVFLHLPSATPEEAVGLGQAAAAAVTARLPPPIELKFEKVFAPLLLLHVNRYAGRTFETAWQAAAGQGVLALKGVKAIWRQSAPIVAETLSAVLDRVLMHSDTQGAIEVVERQVRRLLTGDVTPYDLTMTGGLWRVTGQQVAAAAAAGSFDEEDEGEEDLAALLRGAPQGSGGGRGGGRGGRGGRAGASSGRSGSRAAAAEAPAAAAEDVKGPHANLAVRLSQRDPDRTFVLGERLPYVLLAGAAKQDDAAEDPLTACLNAMAPNTQLYFVNKLQPPLQEIMKYALTPAQMKHVLEGPHTRVRASGAAGELQPLGATGGPTAAAAATPGANIAGLPPAGLASPQRQRPAAGAAPWGSPGASGSGGAWGVGGGRLAGASPGRGASSAGRLFASPSGKRKALQQGGMKSFFVQQERCLGCRSPMPSAAGGGGGLFGSPVARGSDNGSGGGAGAPGLCQACRSRAGAWVQADVSALSDANRAETAAARAAAACRRCHSGGQMLGPVLCLNGECPVLYVRETAARAEAAAARRLERLDAAANDSSPFAW